MARRKLSLFSDLVAVVQWRKPVTATFGLGWHTMAAFDSLRIAEKYRADCIAAAASDPEEHRLEYRVVSVPAKERL